MLTGKLRFLVTYGWCRSSYSLARALKSNGFHVVSADESRVGMCQSSCFVDAHRTYRHPFQDSLGFVEDLTSICRDHEIDVLIPGHEEAEIIGQFRSRFPSSLEILMPELSEFRRANDKHECTDFAMKIGLPVARRIAYARPSDLVNLTGPSERYVLRSRRGNSSKGTRYASGGEALERAVNDMVRELGLDADRLPVIQERVTGSGWGVSCLFWHGRMVSAFTHVRLKEKIASGGTSTLRKSAKNEVLVSYASEILASLNWHGFAMVEFKYDESADIGHFIEINPRLWGSFDLAIQSGMDFSGLVATAMTKGFDAARAQANAFPIRQGHVSQWLLGEWIRRFTLLVSGSVRETVAVESIEIDSYDDLRRDDLRAFVGELRYYLAKALSSRSVNPISRQIVN